MHDPAVKDKFMVFRAHGKSFDTIAKELKVGRRTLVTWESACKEEIANLKAIELEALRERFWLTIKAQTELFGEQLARVIEELGKRDFSDGQYIKDHKNLSSNRFFVKIVLFV